MRRVLFYRLVATLSAAGWAFATFDAMCRDVMWESGVCGLVFGFSTMLAWVSWFKPGWLEGE